MKIKSKSDVITNSSNEVFCFKMDEDYEELKREIPEIPRRAEQDRRCCQG